MGKTRLRVGKGVTLTPDFLVRLANMFDCSVEDVAVEYYGDQDDFQLSYSRRKTSILAAFRFLMESVPPSCDKASLEKYLTWCDEHSPLPDPTNNNIDDYQNKLAQYTASLVNALIDYWPFTGTDKDIKRNAVAFLNKAEQYDIMRKGRPDLATLSVSGKDNGKIILRWEKQLPACSDETLSELRTIKASQMGLTPDWFRNLPVFQQIYLHGSESYLKTKELLDQDIFRLQSAWLQAKSTVEETLFDDLKAIAQNTNLPQWYRDLSPAHRSTMRELSFQPVSKLSDIDSRLQSLVNEIRRLSPGQLNDIGQLRQLPYWFTVFPDYEQRFLKNVLSKTRAVADAVFFIPSRLRMIPGLANFCQSNAALLSREGELIDDFGSQLRSSHVASRDVRNLSRQVIELHTNRNVMRLIQFAQRAGKTALEIQTLVSPAQTLDGFIPDYLLDQERIRAVNELKKQAGFEIHTTNHSLNDYRYWDYTQSNNEDCLALLNRAKEKLSAGVILAGMQDLSIPETGKELVCQLLTKCLPFIEECPDHQVFSQLLLLAKSLLPIGLSPDHCLERVEVAWKDALTMKRSPECLSGRSSPVNDEEKAHLALVEYFAGHDEKLQAIAAHGWQKVLARLWYLSGHHGTSTPNVLKEVDKTVILAEIVRDYARLLYSPYFTATIRDYHGREMVLSALEGLLAKYMGDTQMYGSCISGKDRKELQLTFALSMQVYHDFYGQWPSYFDAGRDRANFVDIVSDLYITRHGAEHSGQNATGADGIKHPNKYLPADISAAIRDKIGQKSLKNHDRLASNNELKDIDMSALIQKNAALCTVAALKLSEDSRSKLLGQMKIINDELPHWKEKTSYTIPFFASPIPAGVVRTQEILNNVCSTTIEALAETYLTLMSRPKSSWLRAKITQEYYTCVLSLIDSGNPEALLPDVLKNLESIKQRCFTFNPKTPDVALMPPSP